MITEQQLRNEIERIKADMATTEESARDYQIGALAALLWAVGDYDRGTAFMFACQAWDKARPAPLLQHGQGAL
jgi:hypothetical protein